MQLSDPLPNAERCLRSQVHLPRIGFNLVRSRSFLGHLSLACLMTLSCAGFVQADSVWQLDLLIKIADQHHDVFDHEFRLALKQARWDFKRGDKSSGDAKVEEAILGKSCTLSKLPSPGDRVRSKFPVQPKDSPLIAMLKILEDTQPGSLKKLARQSVDAEEDRFIKQVALPSILMDFDRAHIGPLPPSRPSVTDRTTARTAFEEARTNEVIDSPRQGREQAAAQGSALRIADRADDADKKYDSELAAYRKAKAAWDAGAPARKREREALFHLSRAQLLSTLNPASLGPRGAAFNAGLKFFEQLSAAVAKSSALSLQLISKPAFLTYMSNYQSSLLKDKELYPNQSERNTRNLELLNTIARKAIQDGREGALKPVSIYSTTQYTLKNGKAASLAGLVGEYGVQDARDEEDAIVKSGWESAGALLLAASMGPVGEGAAGTLMLGGLAASAVPLGMDIAEKGFKQEQVGQAVLFGAMLAAGPAGKILKEAELLATGVKAAGGLEEAGILARSDSALAKFSALLGGEKKARRFLELLRDKRALGILEKFKSPDDALRFFSLADKASLAQFSYVTLQGLQEIAVTAQDCDQRDYKKCANDMVISLIKILPQAFDLKRKLSAHRCPGGECLREGSEPLSRSTESNISDITNSMRVSDEPPAETVSIFSRSVAEHFSDTSEAGGLEARLKEIVEERHYSSEEVNERIRAVKEECGVP